MGKLTVLHTIATYLDTIGYLSPSDYFNSETSCYLQLLSKRNIPPEGKTPSHYKAILGTIAHKLLELSRKGVITNRRDFKAKWKELIAVQEERLKSLYPTLQNCSISDFELCNKTWSIANSLIGSYSNGIPIPSGNSSPFGAEKRVQLDGIIKGSIDLVRPFEDGAEIIDYKTGSVINEEGMIKDSYRLQLNLYAALFEATYDIPVKKLTISAINGTDYDVPKEVINASNLMSEAQSILTKINSLLDTADVSTLCNYSENCRFCNIRHLCPSFQMHSSEDALLIGKLLKVPNRNVIVIENVKDSNQTVVNNFETIDVDMQEYIGQKLILINLYKRDNLPLALSPYSLIYVLDEK